MAVAVAAALLTTHGACVAEPPHAPFGSPAPTTTLPPQGSDVEGVFSDGFYTFGYPAGWRLSDTTGERGLIRADLVSPDGSSGLQVRVQETAGADVDAFVDRYLERFVEDMNGHWPGTLTQVSRSSVVVAGHRMVTVALVHRRDDGSAWLLKQYLWFAPAQVVILQAGTPLEERHRVEPVLDGIAASLSP
jgi:hypothetical protein